MNNKYGTYLKFRRVSKPPAAPPRLNAVSPSSLEAAAITYLQPISRTPTAKEHRLRPTPLMDIDRKLNWDRLQAKTPSSSKNRGINRSCCRGRRSPPLSSNRLRLTRKQKELVSLQHFYLEFHAKSKQLLANLQHRVLPS